MKRAFRDKNTNAPARYAAFLVLPLLVCAIGSSMPALAVKAQTPTPTGGPPPLLVAYPAGWNLLSVTQAGSGIPANIQLYTLTPDGTAYSSVSPSDTRPGVGYWAYFPTDNHVLLVPQTVCLQCGAPFAPITLPADQWVMVGDPVTLPVTVSGADALYVYDPAAAQYRQTTRLNPGEGAFVFSATGGTLTYRYVQ
jgi:hypothetical protein